jgi:hypothetical protein
VTGPTARDLWHALEPVHAVVYFDEGCRASMTDLGLPGFWSGYFAGRAAPLGPVGPDVVAAIFCTFAPAMVARALPDAWAVAAPGRVWEARRAGAAAALRRVDRGVDERAAVLLPSLARAVRAAPEAGRPLFAATRAAGWPDDPVEALWHACTCLREHRGDGHVAALTASGLNGCEALVLFAASEGLPEAMFLSARGWSADEWAAAAAALTAGGLLDAGGISVDGARLRSSVEAMTDHQAERVTGPWSEAERRDVLDGLRPLGAAIHAAGVIAYPNPMGLPEPSAG